MPLMSPQVSFYARTLIISYNHHILHEYLPRHHRALSKLMKFGLNSLENSDDVLWLPVHKCANIIYSYLKQADTGLG